MGNLQKRSKAYTTLTSRCYVEVASSCFPVFPCHILCLSYNLQYITNTVQFGLTALVNFMFIQCRLFITRILRLTSPFCLCLFSNLNSVLFQIKSSSFHINSLQLNAISSKELIYYLETSGHEVNINVLYLVREIIQRKPIRVAAIDS